jgi:hypothetical protein
MGDSARLAQRLDLIRMQLAANLSSTGYVLANEGSEYVVLQPTATADPFTLMLEPGTYQAEWSASRHATLSLGTPCQSIRAPRSPSVHQTARTSMQCSSLGGCR